MCVSGKGEREFGTISDNTFSGWGQGVLELQDGDMGLLEN